MLICWFFIIVSNIDLTFGLSTLFFFCQILYLFCDVGPCHLSEGLFFIGFIDFFQQKSEFSQYERKKQLEDQRHIYSYCII